MIVEREVFDVRDMVYLGYLTHYYHSNIILPEYCDRPYKSIEEMNEALIANFNELVGPKDDVFHLGDFAFGRGATPSRVQAILRRLNGRIHLIKGNHDSEKRLKEIGGFQWIKDVYKLRYEKLRFWLSHYAHRRWPGSHKGTFHLYGHSHGNLPGYGRSMDVGVDAWDYKPVHIDKVVKVLEKQDRTEHHHRDKGVTKLVLPPRKYLQRDDG